MNFSNHKNLPYHEDRDSFHFPSTIENEETREIDRRDLAKRALEEHKLNYLEEGLLQLQISDSDTDEERNKYEYSHPEKENQLFLTTSKTPYKSREIRTEGSSESSRRLLRSPLLDITPNPTKRKRVQPLYVLLPLSLEHGFHVYACEKPRGTLQHSLQITINFGSTL